MTLPILVWDQAFNRSGDRTLQRTVANAIRTYMDNTTLTGWVKAETLSKDTGIKERTVREQIAACVAAGWLEVVESGNSSGKANTYRLTFPRDHALQRTLEGGPDHAAERMVSEEPCATAQGNHVLQRTPTTPRTSPERSSFRTTTPEENHALQRRVPDPWGSVTDIGPAVEETTTESNHAPQRRVAEPPPFEDPFATPQPWQRQKAH